MAAADGKALRKRRTHDLSRWAAAGRSPAEIVGPKDGMGRDHMDDITLDR